MNILICDDEPVLADELEQWLEQYPERTADMMVRKCYSAQEAMQAGIIYDLAILDIELGSQTGLEVAEWLQQCNPQILLLFISSHIEYVSETFRIAAFQFLPKPVTQRDFYLEIKRAAGKYQQYCATYAAEGRAGAEDILLRDILYIEVRRKKLYLYTAQQTHCLRGSMEEMERQLNGAPFVRCHQSYLVNLRHIAKIGHTELQLKHPTSEGNTNVPVSRQRRADIEHRWKGYQVGVL